MKKLVLFLLLLSPLVLSAQKNELKLSPYYLSDPGRYSSLEYGRSISKNSKIFIGFLFHYNNTIENPDRHQEYYLHHRFKAYESYEHFGLSLGYQNTFYRFNNDHVSLFAYDQLMVRRMGARSKRFVPFDTIFNYDNYGYFYDMEISEVKYTHIHNLFSVENISGIGLDAKISESLSVNMKAGIGFHFINNLPQPLFDKKSALVYSVQFGFGISYSF